MAKCKDPFGAREARGSVGGITASRNSMGQILRCKASPVQPRSSSQQERRYTFQKLNRAFQDLSSAQIQSWIDVASSWPVTDVFGDSIHITGMNWYIALNSRLDAIGVSLHNTPPLNPNCSFNPHISIYQRLSLVGDIMCKLDVSIPAKHAVWLQWSDNLPKTSQFAKKSLRQRQILKTQGTDAVKLIDYDDLSPDDSLRQFTAFAVDDHGRATPPLRFTVYPTTP